MRSFVNRITTWDQLLFLQIFNWNGKRFLDRLFLLISRSGDGYGYLFAAAFLGWTEPVSGQAVVFSLLAAFAMELSLYKVIKSNVKRDRPFMKIANVRFLITPPDQFSFPSGHTAAAFLFAVVVGSFYPVWILPLSLWALAVGISRVYLGVHYPTDILVGALLGVFSAKLSLIFF